MTKTAILTAVVFALTFTAFGQAPIDVAENTVKVSASGEEIFYYGFAEGDQLIFSFEEVNGKELKEIEIMAMPSSSLFLDYKAKKIDNKILNIPETGVYKFRFTNSNLLAGRVCKFKIQRIPASEETKKFNTTAYKRIIYDTAYYEAAEKYLVRTDTVVAEILNQTAKVHSVGNVNGNKTFTNFRLPDNTIAWSYYIGVDQSGQQAYENATKQLASNATPLVGTNPLAALTLNLTSYLPRLQSGEDIDYYLTPIESINLFAAGRAFKYYKTGKVINDFAKMDPIPGNLSFCFFNDNAITAVAVMIKVTAVQVNNVWDTRQEKKMNITSRQEVYLKN